MSQDMKVKSVAVVGAGLIGSSWATIFSSAGLHVTLYDSIPRAREDAMQRIKANRQQLRQAKLLKTGNKMGDVQVCGSLTEALRDADYVQESVLETIESKRSISIEIDSQINDHTLVGSSSSGIPASEFTESLSNRERFFVVHPVNPPHLIPVVEIVPSPWSDKSHIPIIRDFMESIGQEPMVVNKEIDGFILNRLQGALLNEAFALYAEGYASIDDIDRTVRAGLGLRWSHMGPFETIDLNAPDGIIDYAERLQDLYHQIALSRTEPKPWPKEAIARAALEIAKNSQDIHREEKIQSRDGWLLHLKNKKDNPQSI